MVLIDCLHLFHVLVERILEVGLIFDKLQDALVNVLAISRARPIWFPLTDGGPLGAS